MINQLFNHAWLKYTAIITTRGQKSNKKQNLREKSLSGGEK
jgi:hypothetical protein